MSKATSNRTAISIIKEVTPGTTPATPAFQALRFTGESLKSNLTTTVSEEIRSDRSTANLIPTDQSNAGDIMGEMSGLTYDKLLEGALFADVTWTTPTAVAKTTLAVTANGFTDSANGFITAGLQVGQWVKASVFTNALNNVYYKILTLSAGVITTYPAPVAVQAAGTSSFLKGSTITNGVTDSSFSIQKTFNDTTAVTYTNFKGQRVSTMKVDLAVGAIAKITFGFMGMTSTTSESQIAGATLLPATTTEIMNCVSNVTNIIAKGAGITTALNFTDLSMSYDNKLRELKAIGTLGSIDIRPGTIEAKATINPYFEDKQLLDAFLANTAFELSFQITGSDGYSYIFSYPSVKFTSQDITAGGKDQDLIIKGEVQAILDATSLTTMRIDRFVP
jgi:hypothetical protein